MVSWEGAAKAWTAGLEEAMRDPQYLLRPDLLYLSQPDPVFSVSLICGWVSIMTAVLGAATGEYSWVDRIWSVTPWVYSWLFTLHPMLALREASPWSEGLTRLTLLATLTTLWGLRLTFNFWRKGGPFPDAKTALRCPLENLGVWRTGGYSGMEDYRWAEVRTWFSPILFQLFNIGFIAFFQNVLLLALVLPAYAAWTARDQALGKSCPRAALETPGVDSARLVTSMVCLRCLRRERRRPLPHFPGWGNGG
jgi:hypothetical protein